MQPTAGSGTPGTTAGACADPAPLSSPDGMHGAAEGAAAATAPPEAVDADAPHTILQRAFPPEADGLARPCLIDLRDAPAFMGSRLRDSFNVPLEALVPRMFILPDRATPLGLIVGGPPEQQKVLGAAAGGGAKQEVEVGAFLSSRGWRVAFCAEATPLLWRAAEEAGLLEVGGDPVALQRRWPFQPSKLLLQQAPLVEELLVRSWVQQQLAPAQGQQQEQGLDGQAQGQEKGQGAGRHSAAPPGLPRSPKVTLRMLDVGCGSGRDLAWLSTRRSTVAVTVPAAGPSATPPGAGDASAIAAAADGAVAEPSGREVEVAVSWECVGLDSWHGALQRAAEVLDLGAVPTGPGGVTLHLVQIGGSGGAAAAVATAAAAGGGAGAADANAASGTASGSGASGCPLRPLPLPGTGAGGGSDGGCGGDGGAKGPAAKKAKKGTGGKGAELLLRYLAGQAGADRLSNGGGDAAATGTTTASALARPAVPVVSATAQPVLPPAPIPPGLGPDSDGPSSAPAAATTGAASLTAPVDTSAAAAAAPAAAPSTPSPASPPPAPDLGGPFDLILCVRFLERSFLPHLPRLLRPGGVLLYSTFVDGPGLRAFGRPSGREHVLQRDELAGSMFGPEQGFQVLRDDVDLTADGREVSMFAARKLEAAGAEGEAGAGVHGKEVGKEKEQPAATGAEATAAGAEAVAVQAACAN